MYSDKKIMEMQGQLVGTFTHASSVESPERSLIVFINGLYIKDSDFINHDFKCAYKHFEDFFYAEELQIKDKTNLYNFEFSGQEIVFEDGLKIIIDSESSIDQQNMPNLNVSSYLLFSKSKFVIERIYKEKKILLSDSTLYLEAIQNLNKSINSTIIFDQIISSLRLLKSSAIYRDHRIQSRSLTFQPGGGVLTTIPLFENTVIGGKCELNEEETVELVKIYKFISKEKDSRFGVAIRRLTSGIERKNYEDRLIDYMIGLETLYLPDGNAELSFRLSLRISFLLNSNPNERKETYKFIRDMYDIRSNIVHGKQYTLTIENVILIEELLRKSLKLWINSKENFLHKVKNAKNELEDGRLNNIFFE